MAKKPGKHRGNTDNLRPPWRPGDPSPNPKGRPKKKTLQELIERLAGERFDGDKTRAEAFVEKLWADAIAGKDNAVKIVLDRHDGPVKQMHEHSGDATKPVVFAWADPPKRADDGDG